MGLLLLIIFRIFMADTIITNSPERDGGGGAGWVVALVIIIAAVVGGVLLYRSGAFRSAAPASNTINVTVPNPVSAPTQ
ncbi:MAG: hypothetical protein RL641_218 [Candidatus Parcubacteria bacterium]|jgi:hypothetical protein